MATLTVDREGRARHFAAEDFPLSLGGARSHIPLAGHAGSEPAAHLGQDHGDIFIQPSGDATVSCNGVPLTTSKWLDDGDHITVGESRIRCTSTAEGFLLTVQEGESRPRDSAGPVLERRIRPAAETEPIRPRPFTPRWQAPAPRRAFRVRPRAIFVVALLALLAVCAWYVLTAHSVAIMTDPPADRMALSGGLAPGFDGRFLLRPGSYRLEAERIGHVPIDVEFEVGRGHPQTRTFAFEPLGGIITITSRPVSGASVVVDGTSVGTTPVESLALSAGTHAIEIETPLHLGFSATVTVEPGDPPTTLEAELVPNWAPVTVSSFPPGAEIRLDRSRVGTTPATLEVEAGTRMLEIGKAGFKPASRSLEIVAGNALDLGVVRLTPNDGRLAVSSQPSGATVTVDSTYRGTTPLEIAVSPNVALDLKVSAAGHATYSTGLTVAPGQRLEVRADLEMLTGDVTITSQPPGAELLIDGHPRGRTGQTIELEARSHEIEVRLQGYVPHRTTIVPEPGVTQSVRASLTPAGAAGLPQTITTPQGAELVLVGPGRFTMGASRREPGRRANEVLREVEITKPFYIAVREVTNREFREFASGHLSGAYGGQNLEIDHHPVVNVSWDEAARYCNWLSEKEGLPPVYAERAGSLVPRSPLPLGYRLPTEAEWAWAARYAGSTSPTKYGWGDSLPIPNGSGNYGDASAEAILHAAVPNYRDSYPATAPAGSFAPNDLGLFNVGGNVAEWTQDFYTFTPGEPGVVEQDPTGPTSGAQHVVRGASWMDTAVTELRLTSREGGDQPRPDLGFRIARSSE